MIFSNEQLAGQRLMVGFEGTQLDHDLMYLIDTIKAGGLILFSKNLSTPAQIKALCSDAQEYAFSCGQPPLFISIDQEGGEVARLKEPFTRLPGNPAMKGEKDAKQFATVTANELTRIGVNMNLAPVMDVVPKGSQSVMAGRVFGHDPAWVSKMGVHIIKHLQQNGIMAVSKHFPGIGRVILDPHHEISVIHTKLHDFESFDLLPFESSIKHNVTGIMLSHILYRGIDPDWPASLSILIAKNLLRNRMGFQGLVITDDMDMGAIKKNYDTNTIVKQFLAADIDILLICHKGPDIVNAYVEILKSIVNSQILKKKGIESLNRIIKAKKKYIL